MAATQLIPEEDGARKGSTLVHGAATVQLVHAHELDDIAGKGMPFSFRPSRNSHSPSLRKQARTVQMIPYGMDL